MKDATAHHPVTWIKSSYSGSNGGQCVEFARELASREGRVPVRDSKTPHGPALVFGAGAWTTFVTALRADGLGAG